MRLTGKNNQLSACLHSFVRTRWNTVVEMFESFLRVHAEIQQLLTKDDILARFTKINVTLLTEVINFLKLFKNVSVELESDKNVTSVKILPAIEMIIDHIKIQQDDSPTIRKMKERAETYINDNKRDVLPKNYELWAFFHPNFKRLQGFKTIDKSVVMESIEFLVGLHNDTVNNVLISTETESVNEPSSVSNRSPKESVFNSLQDNVDMDNHSISAEMDRYMNTKHAVVNNLLDWWSQHKEMYPQLYQYFLLFAAIPATSASAERIFSDAGNIITNKRSRLSPKNVNQLAFLHRNYKRKNY